MAMASELVVDRVIELSERVEAPPGSGYFAGLQGEKTRIKWVGSPGNEDGWLYVERCGPPLDSGWLHMNFAVIAPVQTSTAQHAEQHEHREILNAELPTFEVGGWVQLGHIVSNFTYLGFAEPLRLGDRLQIEHVGVAGGDNEGWLYARRQPPLSDAGWISEAWVAGPSLEVPSGSSARASSDVASSIWECNTCGETNKGSRVACNNCGMERPPLWECPGCGEPNKPSRISCNNCGLTRHSQGVQRTGQTAAYAAARATAHAPLAAPYTIIPNPHVLPPQSGLRICVVGDSGLQLSKSKGSANFQQELESSLPGAKSVQIVRFPGEGAEKITHYLYGNDSFDVVIAVWFLNELFDAQMALVPDYPSQVDRAARRLADALKRYPCRAAVVGGFANMWGVPEKFDTWAQRVRDVMEEQHIAIDTGYECYAKLTMKGDGWHARSTPENKWHMAASFATLIKHTIIAARAR